MKTVSDYRLLIRRRLHYFEKIARELGKEHPVTKLMGSLSYGRHNFETGMAGGLRALSRELGALDGTFDVLNRWARDNDTKAQKIMLDIYDSSFSTLDE